MVTRRMPRTAGMGALLPWDSAPSPAARGFAFCAAGPEGPEGPSWCGSRACACRRMTAKAGLKDAPIGCPRCREGDHECTMY